MPIGQIAQGLQHCFAMARAGLSRPESMNDDLAIRIDDELDEAARAAFSILESILSAASRGSHRDQLAQKIPDVLHWLRARFAFRHESSGHAPEEYHRARSLANPMPRTLSARSRSFHACESKTSP